MTYPFWNNQGVNIPQMYPSSSISQMANNTLGTEIISVNGILGAYQCALPPNTRSIMVADTEKPLIYLISNNNGNREVQAFDIAPHVEQQQTVVDVEEKVPSSDDILQEIRNKLNSMEDDINELKSNTTSSKSEPKSKYDNKSNKSAKSNGNTNEASH